MLVGGALLVREEVPAGKAAVLLASAAVLEEAGGLDGNAGAGVSGAVSHGLALADADLEVVGLGGDVGLDLVGLALLLAVGRT